MAKIVIALGGNALGNNPKEQKELVKIPAQKIVDLINKGHNIIVGHGNGPQVGMIFNAFNDAKEFNSKTPNIPFAEAGAMSQGYIGLHLLNALTNQLLKKKIDKEVIYFLTQTIVSKNDPAFDNPTKPVGPFYKTMIEAQKNNPNSKIINDSGRGFRKIVASPIPINFVGINTFKKNINQGAVVILGGGGGIPTILENNQYEPVDGVIDKDFSLAVIADKVESDIFIVLTSVEYVYINFNQPNQKALKEVTISEMESYIKQGQFSKGSMLPKVESAINFVRKNKNRIAIISDLNKLTKAMQGKSGTKIIF